MPGEGSLLLRPFDTKKNIAISLRRKHVPPSEVGSSSGTHPKPGPVSSQSRNPGMGGEASGVIFEGPKICGQRFLLGHFQVES